MKRIRTALVVVSLLTLGEANDAVRADDRTEENPSVTLYTTFDNGDFLTCHAVNVSDKTLLITFGVFDHFGHALSCASPTTCTRGPVIPTTNPTPEFRSLRARRCQ